MSTSKTQHSTRPKPPGGSRKGRPNKTTAAVKDMILAALDDVGGQAYLAEQANKQPVAFMALLGRIMPTQVTTDSKDPMRFVLIGREVIRDASEWEKSAQAPGLVPAV